MNNNLNETIARISRLAEMLNPKPRDFQIDLPAFKELERLLKDNGQIITGDDEDTPLDWEVERHDE